MNLLELYEYNLRSFWNVGKFKEFDVIFTYKTLTRKETKTNSIERTEISCSGRIFTLLDKLAYLRNDLF